MTKFILLIFVFSFFLLFASIEAQTLTVDEDRETVLALEILPKVKDPLFVKTRMWISKKDWIITGMEMVEKNGDTTTLRYSNMRVNMGLADSDFEIRLPKDVKVTEIK